MPEISAPVIYQLKVVLLDVSPMIWRRLLFFCVSTIADPHFTLQVAMGWTDTHLSRFFPLSDKGTMKIRVLFETTNFRLIAQRFSFKQLSELSSIIQGISFFLQKSYACIYRP